MKANLTVTQMLNVAFFFGTTLRSIKKQFLLLPFLLISYEACAQTSITARTVSNTTWLSASTWSANGTISLPPNGSWGKGTSNVGEYIIIEHDIDIANNKIIDLSTSVVKEVRIKGSGSLSFGSNAQLKLPAGAVVVLEEGATVSADNNSAGTLIEIGGTGVWGRDCAGCNNNTLSGPGSITEASNPTSPLPIELLLFQSEVVKGAVQLIWTTAMEDNFDFFTVERAGEDGNFHPLADIKGVGFSAEEVEYSFTDTNPLAGLNLYRLKATDTDGSVEYHRIISAWVEKSHSEVVIYPNPLVGNEKLFINTNSYNSQEVIVADFLGNTLVKTIIKAGANQLELPKELKAGSYLVSVTQADGSKQHVRLLKNY